MTVNSLLDKLELELEKETLRDPHKEKELKKFRGVYGTGYVEGVWKGSQPSN